MKLIGVKHHGLSGLAFPVLNVDGLYPVGHRHKDCLLLSDAVFVLQPFQPEGLLFNVFRPAGIGHGAQIFAAAVEHNKMPRDVRRIDA